MTKHQELTEEFKTRLECLYTACEGGVEDFVIEIIKGIIGTKYEDFLSSENMLFAYQSFCLMIDNDMRHAAQYFADNFDCFPQVLLGPDFKSIWLAANKGNLYLFNLLFKLGKKHYKNNAYLKYQNKYDQNILHAAAELINPVVDISAKILKALPNLIYSPDVHNNLPIHFAVRNSAQLTAFLINAGMKTNISNNANVTALSLLSGCSAERLTKIFDLLPLHLKQELFDKLNCHLAINIDSVEKQSAKLECLDNISQNIGLVLKEKTRKDLLVANVKELDNILAKLNDYMLITHNNEYKHLITFVLFLLVAIAISTAAAFMISGLKENLSYSLPSLFIAMIASLGLIYSGIRNNYHLFLDLHQNIEEKILVPLRDVNATNPLESPYSIVKTKNLTQVVSGLARRIRNEDVSRQLTDVSNKLRDLKMNVQASLNPFGFYYQNSIHHTINVSDDVPLLGGGL